MLADQWCATTWRASPGSFVSLMTLYESNFVRLGWLVSDLRTVRTRTVSRVASDYEFDADAGRIRDPDLEVCVYHDARLAEVRSFHGFQRHPQLSRLQSGLKRELDQRWTRNMMLNKWLEYCAERGHHF
jgi:uncharacterized protein YqiB (DUF1249 family)